MPWQKPNEKIQITKHVGHPAEVPLDNSNPSLLCDINSRIGTFPQPYHWFAHIPVNAVGPLPTSQGYHYLFTVIDHFTRWPEAIPMETATSASYALDVSGAEIVYGDPLVFPAKFFPSQTSSNIFQYLSHIGEKFTLFRQTYKPPAKQYFQTDLPSEMYVFLHNDTSKPLLMPPYTGPFLMIRRTKKAFCINIHGKEDWASINRLKPAYLSLDDPRTVRLSRAGCAISNHLPMRVNDTSCNESN
ncbi:uncharacterized protein [Palaemon carinicauda]|uniref:uncharacterized protein n=1 Tax=Palaemon carinicauda TaxID=392227 RepID=UPI0035B68071